MFGSYPIRSYDNLFDVIGIRLPDSHRYKRLMDCGDQLRLFLCPSSYLHLLPTCGPEPRARQPAGSEDKHTSACGALNKTRSACVTLVVSRLSNCSGAKVRRRGAGEARAWRGRGGAAHASLYKYCRRGTAHKSTRADVPRTPRARLRAASDRPPLLDHNPMEPSHLSTSINQMG